MTAAPRFAYRADVFALFLVIKYLDRAARQPGFSAFDLAREAKVPKAAVGRAMSGRPVRWQRFLQLCQWQGEDPRVFARRA